MASSEFDKDFGYLMPFLDRLSEAARNLAGKESNNELTLLIAEEKRRWARIRELLSADASSDATTPDNTKALHPLGESPKPAHTFTVGSLRSREEKSKREAGSSHGPAEIDQDR